MKPARIRILIVDDHPVVVNGLTAMIDPEPDMQIVASAGNGPDAVRLFRDRLPDVTLMDLNLTPAMTGVEAIQAIRHEYPEARVIVLSAYKGEEDIFHALKAGAATYLLKDSLGEELLSTIREVHAGGGPIPAEVGRKLADRLNQTPLTAREIEILKLMAEGKRNKEVAGRLGVTSDTVQQHIKNIYSKLQVHDRTEAVTVAIRRGILHIT